MIYFVSYESEFCLENATMFQIKDMFENGKPDIVLKTVKGFYMKRTSFIISIPENTFKLGIVVLVILYKMLSIFLIIDFDFRYGLRF